MFEKFRGTERDHEHQNPWVEAKWNDEPQRIVVSAAEWSAFRSACERVGVEPSGANYFHWRLREQPFA